MWWFVAIIGNIEKKSSAKLILLIIKQYSTQLISYWSLRLVA